MSSSEATQSVMPIVKYHGVKTAGNLIAMKFYEGKRLHEQTVVTVDDCSLKPRFDLCLFDFNGFEWGYESSGTMQLSLALLADHLNNDKQAVSSCGAFARALVAKLPDEGWRLSSEQIEAALISEKMV